MDILNVFKKLRDDLKVWATNNFNALNAKIDEKTIPIDTGLNSESTNPVQNKAIATEIADLNNRVGDTPVVTQISDAIAKQPHFSGDYNDLTNAPNIYEDNSGNIVITDDAGNIIFKIDSDGVHTTELTLNNKHVASEEYVDNAIATKVDFTGYATERYVEQSVEDVKTKLGESIESESSDLNITDNDGNIIFKVDGDGITTTTVTANNVIVNGNNIDSHISDDVIHVTSYEKENWNNKSNFSGSYNDLTDTPEQIDVSIYSTKIETEAAINSIKNEISNGLTSDASELHITDSYGNIVATVNNSGLNTVGLFVNDMPVLHRITSSENSGLKVTNNNNIDFDDDVVFVINGGTSNGHKNSDHLKNMMIED